MAQDVRELVLVLASQRSGSTLLCRDIESLGGMGAPGEHFLPILGKNARAGLNEQNVLDRIAAGTCASRPEIGAVKLMVNYAPKIDAYIRGGEAVSPAKAIENILNWAQVRFDKVCVFALVRGNSLDQAISRAVAKTTDIWHRNQAAVQENDPYEGINLKTNVLNTEILDALPSVVRQSQVIRRVAKNRPEICRLVRYEDMVGSVEDSSQVLVEHAVALGFQPEQKVAQRNLVKLIKEDHSAQIKESFRQFLQKHLGDELWQT